MKFLIVFVALFALAVAAPIGDESLAQVIRNESDVGPESHSASYETNNGISASESGKLRASNNQEETIYAVQGQYSYTAPDGTPILVRWIADENGFQPEGAHLPTV